jgi:hypothetical protein
MRQENTTLAKVLTLVCGLAFGAFFAVVGTVIYLYFVVPPSPPNSPPHATGLGMFTFPLMNPFYLLGVLLAFAAGVYVVRFLPRA